MKKSVKKALGILIALLLILIALSASLLIINKPKDRTDNTFVVVKIKEGSSQMVEGAKGMAESTTEGAVNTVSSEMTNVASSSTANSYGNVNSSQQSYSKGSVLSPDTKGSKELVKQNNNTSSKPVNVSGSRQTVARRDASRSESKPLGVNSTRQRSGQQAGSKVDNVTPISSNSKMDTVKSVMTKGQQVVCCCIHSKLVYSYIFQ